MRHAQERFGPILRIQSAVDGVVASFAKSIQDIIDILREKACALRDLDALGVRRLLSRCNFLIGQQLKNDLLHLVDEDTEAFNCIMAAFGMPKKTDEDKAARSKAIQEATLYATQVPLHTMKASFRAFDICKAMAENGNPNSVSDAGVGALAARAAVLGAGLNVKINAGSLKDRETAYLLVAEANTLIEKANAAEKEILAIVEQKL